VKVYVMRAIIEEAEKDDWEAEYDWLPSQGFSSLTEMLTAMASEINAEVREFYGHEEDADLHDPEGVEVEVSVGELLGMWNTAETKLGRTVMSLDRVGMTWIASVMEVT
jgi:hypothetical protein